MFSKTSHRRELAGVEIFELASWAKNMQRSRLPAAPLSFPISFREELPQHLTTVIDCVDLVKFLVTWSLFISHKPTVFHLTNRKVNFFLFRIILNFYDVKIDFQETKSATGNSRNPIWSGSRWYAA